MKYFILFILMIQGIMGFAGHVPAIVLTSDSTGYIMTVNRYSPHIIINVDGNMEECNNGEYTAITEYLFTGVYVYKDGEEVPYLYPVSDAKTSMIGTQMFGGKVVGLYCPLTPRHIINYTP